MDASACRADSASIAISDSASVAPSASEVCSYDDENFDAESQGFSESAAALTQLNAASSSTFEQLLPDEELPGIEPDDQAKSQEEKEQEVPAEDIGSQGFWFADHYTVNAPEDWKKWKKARDDAALRIQSAQRGRSARQRVTSQRAKLLRENCSKDYIARLTALTIESLAYASDARERSRDEEAEKEATMDLDFAHMEKRESIYGSPEYIDACQKIQRIERGRAGRREAARRRQEARQVREEARYDVEPPGLLPDKRSMEEEQHKRAVVKIQSYQRGRMARRRMRKFRKKAGASETKPPQDPKDGPDKQREEAAALAIQKAQRKLAAQKEAAYRTLLRSLVRNSLRGLYDLCLAEVRCQLMREEQLKAEAAVRLQCAARGRMARSRTKRLQEEKQAAAAATSAAQQGRRSQARSTNKVIRKELLSEDAQAAILKIQNSVRKVWHTKQHQAVKKQQKKLIRKHTAEDPNDDTSPQAIRQRLELSRKAKEESACQERSALQIQRIFRGRAARSKSKKMIEERERVRREARRAAQQREAQWEQGLSAGFCISSRLSVAHQNHEAAARRIQRFTRKRSNSFMKTKTREQYREESGQPSLDTLQEENNTQAEEKIKAAELQRRGGCIQTDGSEDQKQKDMDEAIVRIQAAQRQRQAKKEAKARKHEKEMEDAVTRIQAARRGIIARRQMTIEAEAEAAEAEARQQATESREQTPQKEVLPEAPVVDEEEVLVDGHMMMLDNIIKACNQDTDKLQQFPREEEDLEFMFGDPGSAAIEAPSETSVAEAATTAGCVASADRPITRRSFDAQWQDESSSAATEASLHQAAAAAASVMPVRQDSSVVATDSASSFEGCAPPADVLEAVGASSLSAPPADVLEAAAVAATAAARPTTRRSFDAQSLGACRMPAAAEAAAAAVTAGVAAPAPAAVTAAAAVRPVTRRSFDAQQGLGACDMPAAAEAAAALAEAATSTAAAGIEECVQQASDDPAAVLPFEEDAAVSCIRGSVMVCELSVQCYGDCSDDQDGDMVSCGRARHAANERQPYYFVRDREAQTDAELPEVVSSAYDGNIVIDSFGLEAQALWPSPLWPSPLAVAQPESLPRRCPKSGRRLRRPVPAGTMRAGAIYKNPPCIPVAPLETASAARGHPSAGSTPPSRRAGSARPHSVREAPKAPGSAGPSGSGASASPGLGKVRQPPPMLSAFGRVLSGPTPCSAHDLLKDRSQSPPTSCSQLRRLCDPLWKIPSANARLRSPATAPATASAVAHLPLRPSQQTTLADVVRQREGLGTAPATHSAATFGCIAEDIAAEDPLPETDRNADMAWPMGLSSAPASTPRRKPKAPAATISVPGSSAKPRSVKPTSKRPPWQDAGKDSRLGMKKLPWLSVPLSASAAAVYDPRFLDLEMLSHYQRPLN